MRGRKPKPNAIKKLEGNPGRRPIPDEMPSPEKDATCPAWLEPEAKREWKRLSPWMHSLKILTDADRAAFATYCQAYARWREAEEFLTKHGPIVKTPSGYWQQVPQVSIAQTYCKIMTRIASEFGLTPSARSRIVMAQKADMSPRDEMDEILGDL